MSFKKYLLNEEIEEFIKYAEDFGKMNREDIQKLLYKRNKDYLNNFISHHDTREKFTKFFGWSIPCKEAVDLIKRYAREPLYDVMAGTGYWSRILKKEGVDIRPSDIHKISNKNYYHRERSGLNYSGMRSEKSKIRRKNAIKVAIDLNNNRIKGDIFLSWPPYKSCTATNILEFLPIGTRVFYIGESEGGCTGDLSFHKYLEENFKLLAIDDLPQFIGIHDYISVYEKTDNKTIDNKYKGKSFDWDLEEE